MAGDVEIRIVGKDEASGPIGGVTASIKGMVEAFALVEIGKKAFEGLTEGVKGSIEAAIESQKIGAQTAAVIKSTGDASGETAEQIDSMAKALANHSTFATDTIQQGENMLLTFTNIGKTVFPSATQAVTDMTASFQAAGKQMNISDVAILVGKALNDPVNGMAALHRVGVAFTDDQKQVIAQMIKTGDVAGAQRVIIGELNREFGGSAAAQAGTYAGQLEILHNKLHDVQIRIGEALLPILTRLASAVMPIVVALFERLPGLVDRVVEAGQRLAAHIAGPLSSAFHIVRTLIGDIIDQHGDLGVFHDDLEELFHINITPLVNLQRLIGEGLGKAFSTLMFIIRAAREEIGFFIESFKEGGIGAALDALRTTLIDRGEEIFRWVTGSLLPRVAEIGKGILSALVTTFRAIDWGQLAQSLLYGLGRAFYALGTMAGSLAGDLQYFATYLVSGLVGLVRAINWANLGTALMEGIAKALSVLQSIGSQAIGFGASLLRRIVAEVRSIDWAAVGSAILDGLSTALTFLQNIGGRALGFGQALLARVVAEVQTVDWSRVGQVIQANLGNVLSTLGSLADRFAPLRELGTWISTTLLPVFSQIASLVGSQLGPSFDRLKQSLDQTWQVLKDSGVLDQARLLFDALRTAAVALKPVLEVIAIVVGGVLFEAFNLLLNIFAKVLPAAVVVTIGILKLVMATITALADLVSGAVKIIEDLIHGRWSQAWADAKATVQKVATDIGTILLALGDWILHTALPVIAADLLAWGEAFVSWVAPRIVPLLLELGKLELQLADWLLTVALPDIIEKLVQWGVAFVAWVAPQIPPLLLELGKLLVEVGKWILTTAIPDVLKKFGDMGSQAGKALVSGILDGLKAAWKDITSWISGQSIHIPFIGGGGGPGSGPTGTSNPAPTSGIAGEGARVLNIAESTPGQYLWCEKFIGDVMAAAGLHYSREPTAEVHAHMQPLNPGLGPAGAIVFYPWQSDGHVAFSMGDGQHIYGTADTPSGTGIGNGWWTQPYGWTVNPAAQGLYVSRGPALVLMNEAPAAQGEIAAPIPMLRQVVAEGLNQTITSQPPSASALAGLFQAELGSASMGDLAAEAANIAAAITTPRVTTGLTRYQQAMAAKHGRYEIHVHSHLDGAEVTERINHRNYVYATSRINPIG